MDWSEMREMHRNGMSITQISREAGCDRKTVRRYIGAEVPPQYRRAGGSSVLDPFKDHLKARLAEHPLSAARLYREIKELEYSGSLTTVKRFIAPIRNASKILAEVRFETKPGEQAQVDWIDLGRMPVGDTVEHVYVFVMVLSWSRMRFIRMTFDCHTDTFIDCHLKAFEHFGGWTKTILYDNLKSVVLKRALLSSESTFNPMYRECFVRYLNNFYSVPWRFAKRQCQLEIREGVLTVRCAGEEIARHDIVPGSNAHVKILEHFAGLHKLKRDRGREGHERRIAGQGSTVMPMFSFQAPVDVERRDLSTYDVFMGGTE